MELLVLILLFTALGYILASSRLGQKVDQAGTRVGDTTRNLADSVENRWKVLFSRSKKASEFHAWAIGEGASSFPLDFRSWLASLNPQEAKAFNRSLAEYSQTLGFDLNSLVDGGLDSQPILRQVFVEAIVVYSSAYRKAKKAQQQAEAADSKHKPKSTDDRMAEKRAAEGNSTGEANESPSAA